MRLLLAGLLAAAACLGPARAEVAVPPLSARVTDLTRTLNDAQKGEIEARLAAFEKRRGSQMAVLMLPTTKPEEIEQFSIRVAEAWKVGRKGVDDGLLLVIAKDDRRLRAEVGYGLEGVIPDSVAKRVIDEKIVPRFRDGDFFGGVRDGVDQLVKLAEGEKLPAPAPAARPGLASDFNPIEAAIAGFMFAVIAGMFLKPMIGRVPGSLAAAVGVGLVAWLLYSVVFGLLGLVLGFIAAYTNTGKGGGRWLTGGPGGASGGSFGGGSSGWSGGGGGFGGGGASGRW